MNLYVKYIINTLLYATCHLFVIVCCLPISAQTDCMLQIPFETNDNYTATYQEVRSFFHNAANCAQYVDYVTFGMSDAGKPLQMLIVDKSSKFEPLGPKDKRAIILINNGIHPGEPCGIEASMILVRDLIQKDVLKEALDDVVLLIVPVYNIGGMLNRNSHSRANQNGPESYGFRGNAKNLDLNRDFIKADSRNANGFHQLISRWDPDIFIDTHTSNGADYQYTMTLIANMQDRLSSSLRALVYDDMLPVIYENMKIGDYEMVPYVHVRSTPDEGIAAFNDLPRYSMGYGALHHIPSFTTEAHMFKPYRDRVASTLLFLKSMIMYTADNKKEIRAARVKSIEEYQNLAVVPIKWSLNFDQSSEIMFKGYQAKTEISRVTGKERLVYDRSAPYEKSIPYYNRYKTDHEVEVPKMYVLPQAYHKVAQRLRDNGVIMQRARRDSTASSKSYRITNVESRASAYEGHFLHSKVDVAMENTVYSISSGDYVIFTDQPKRRFIVEVLEPQAPDSYMAWNFFDGILMQKEYFSPYIFEDKAAKLLASDAKLRARFEEKKATDAEFANDSYAQLEFIYRSSAHYEQTHMLYPVGRIF